MNWKSFRSRLLLVGIAFPLLAVIILVVPHVHHMAVNLLAVGVSLLGGMEMAALFRARRIPTSSMLAPLLGASVPAGVFLEVAGALPAGWLGIWVPAALGVILVRAVLIRKDRNLAEVLSYSSSSFFTFLYPGFFLSWFVRLSSLPEPSLSILFFLCLVFGNDMAAYFAGSLWGASSRLDLPVSPQKSVVGFAGGLFGSLVVIGLFLLLTPGFPRFGLPLDIVLGLCTGVTVILGDLLESGLKRSAGVKDSGIVIPARGGILDSVDSMILTAPLFYYFFTLVGG